MKRWMKAPSPALVVAIVALFVALGGTTYAATSLAKNSVGTKQLKNNAVTAPKIKNGSVTTQKMSKSTLAGLKAGTLLTFDAPATATPPLTTLGTVLGDTWAARCTLVSGNAELAIFLKTSDGSWGFDMGQELSTPSVSAYHAMFPAGTFSTSMIVGGTSGGTAPNEVELSDQGVQLAPVPGAISIHFSVIDTTAPSHTCHMSIDGIPQAVHASGTLGHRPVGTISGLRQFFSRG